MLLILTPMDSALKLWEKRINPYRSIFIWKTVWNNCNTLYIIFLFCLQGEMSTSTMHVVKLVFLPASGRTGSDTIILAEVVISDNI